MKWLPTMTKEEGVEGMTPRGGGKFGVGSGLGRDRGTVNGDHWSVGYSPSGEAHKARLLGTHCQAPTGSPRVDKVKPTLK
ncbi:hypothetical protein E2C01_037511 [Portunus trituberculatus]|uniref:Uncharacterized protein n=1 Tax=Portunus trituberculatus TaxID=210409 RepID=A0A5B7FFU5_PORTR|nr:hypothetical protein [Portunus trituberculatus]